MQKAKANTAGKSPAGAKQPRKLSRAEKKQIAEVIRQAKGDGKVPGRDLPRVGKEILKIRRL